MFTEAETSCDNLWYQEFARDAQRTFGEKQTVRGTKADGGGRPNGKGYQQLTFEANDPIGVLCS